MGEFTTMNQEANEENKSVDEKHEDPSKFLYLSLTHYLQIMSPWKKEKQWLVNLLTQWEV